jgi:hypothetical protein
MKRFLLVSHNKVLSKYCQLTPACGLRTCLLLTSFSAGLLAVILTVCSVISPRWILLNLTSDDSQPSFLDNSWQMQWTTETAPVIEETANQLNIPWRSTDQSDNNMRTAAGLLVKQQQLSFELCFSADKVDSDRTTDMLIGVGDGCLQWVSLLQLQSGLWTTCTLNRVSLSCGKVHHLFYDY